MKKKKETRGRKKGDKNRDKNIIEKERLLKKQNKKKVGRPPGPGKRGHRTKIEIDFKLLGGLCNIQCTASEIAGVMNISVDTLDRRIRELYKVTFADYYKKHSEEGKASLRRIQFKHANTNTAMAIFLGKNLLGQRDKFEYSDVSQEEIDKAILEEISKLKLNSDNKQED